MRLVTYPRFSARTSALSLSNSLSVHQASEHSTTSFPSSTMNASLSQQQCDRSVSQDQNSSSSNNQLTPAQFAALDDILADIGDPHDNAVGQYSPMMQRSILAPTANNSATGATSLTPLESDDTVSELFEGLDPVDMSCMEDIHMNLDDLLDVDMERSGQTGSLDCSESNFRPEHSNMTYPNSKLESHDDVTGTQRPFENEFSPSSASTSTFTHTVHQPSSTLPTGDHGSRPHFDAQYQNFPPAVSHPQAGVVPLDRGFIPNTYQDEQRDRVYQAQQMMMASPQQGYCTPRYVPFHPTAYVPMQQQVIPQHIQPESNFVPHPQQHWIRTPYANSPGDAKPQNPHLYGQGIYSQGSTPRPMNILTKPFNPPPNFMDENTKPEGASKPQARILQHHPSQPEIRVRHSRAGAKVNRLYHQNPLYAQLSQPPASWECFKYTLDGELQVSQVYTPKEITRFLFQHPLRPNNNNPNNPSFPKGSKTLALRIHRNPPSSRDRYPTQHSHVCRITTCPVPNGTINQGQYAISFDEQNAGTDPYIVAGYAHLYCIEKHLDFPRICQTLSISADTRELPQEPGGRNMMKLSSAKEIKIVEDFVVACRMGRVPDGYPRFDQVERPYEGTLCHSLSLCKLKNQPKSIGRQRELRSEEAGYRGSTLESHLGNLEKEMSIRSQTRRHANQAQIVEHPRKNRVFQRKGGYSIDNESQYSEEEGEFLGVGEQGMEYATEDDYSLAGRSITRGPPSGYKTPIAMMGRRPSGYQTPVAIMGYPSASASKDSKVPLAKMQQTQRETNTHVATRGKKRERERESEDGEGFEAAEPCAKRMTRTRSGKYL